ncbi:MULTISPECIES: LysE family translocator [Pontibacillus]|uniref:LysE family translocator n=1 Tax=Pontibacillus chungwhensis TaxID=265426 RepID=A0ABY8UWG9_9BACI|nr:MULTISPECIES: LysE family translocator [Pontibacillus]MCD5325735.1 LysE family translocator [Pontibacillus sp. HN14]WIF98027.1 LysE family translocator [Pontibacillus chungwhensis]
MSIYLLFSFLVAAVVLTLMPGPDNLFVLAQSISQNKKAGIATTLGLCTGILVHTTAAALGITALVYQSSLAFMIVKYAGAIYLLYLAWQAFREEGEDLQVESRQRLDYKKLYKRGVLMNVLNPKVSLFFLALFPQFIDRSTDAFGVPYQMIGLGIIFMVQAFLIFSAISFFSEKLGNWISRVPRIGRRLNIGKGILLGVIGISLVFGEKS